MIRRLELGALIASAIVRIAAYTAFSGRPAARHPMVDAYTYWEQATEMLAGKDPFAEGFYQPPGYPALLWLLGKATAGADLASARIAQLVLGMLTTWAVLVVGRRVGSRAGWPWAGAAAALLYSFYPTTLLFELDILTPAVTSACLAAALVLLVPIADETPAAWRALLAGLALGLAAVVHPTYLLVAAVLIGWLALRARARAALLALGLAACLAPTTAMNLERFGTFTLVSHNSGINFYLGNNPAWRTTAFLRPGLPFRKLALEAEPDKRDVAARNRYWWSRAWSEIARHPDAWGTTLATKAFWSVHDTEIPRNEDYRCRTGPGGDLRWMGLLPVRFGWVLPLAVAGAFAAIRRGWSAALLPPAWLALHAPLVLYLVADRYRLATWPVVAVLAALGAGALIDAVRRRERPGARTAAAVTVAAVLPWVPIDPRTARSDAMCAYSAANLAYMEEEWAEAEAGYERVVAMEPRDPGAHNWLAQLAEKRADTAAAIAHIEVVLDQFPDHFPSLRFLARQHEKAGDRDAAIRAWTAAWRVPGDRTATGARLVSLLVEAGREDEARAVVAEDPELANHPKVREALGR